MMKKYKLTDQSLSKQRDRQQKPRVSPKPVFIPARCPSAKLQKYLNTTLNLPGEKPTYRDSVQSRKTNIVKNKRTHSPLYDSFKQIQSSSLKKLTKSKNKLSSSAQIKQTKKKIVKTKLNISEKEEYLVRQFEEQNQKEKPITQIQKLIRQFRQRDQIQRFQDYIKQLAQMNERISQLLQSVQESKYKSVISKYKNLTVDISNKCLSRLFDRIETADASINNTFEKLQASTKQKYEKKIQKLLLVIAQKQKKQKEVNKLLYFLRKSGIDIDDYWNKSVSQQRRCKTQLQKRFVNDM